MRNYVVRLVLFFLFTLFFNGCQIESPLIWKSINVCHYHQGDAHLITKGTNAYLLDTGEAAQTKKFLLPELKKAKIKSLEIIISHPHFDHYGGVVTLLKSNIKVTKIHMNMPTKAQMQKEWWGGKYSDLIQIVHTAKQMGVPIVPIHQGDIFPLGKHTYMKVLSVYDGIHTPVGQTDINDMSAVIMLYDYRHRYLFTGDLNRKLGTFLAQKRSFPIKADILKAPHHGAETMPPDLFFYKVAPKQIIVTAPEPLWRNKRTKRIKEIAKKLNSKVYVNGLHGTITIRSTKSSYSISVERGFIFLH